MTETEKYNSDLDDLTVDVIQSHLDTDYLGRKMILFKSTASTNDLAWEHTKDFANHGLVVITEDQLAGRGRQSNQWFSRPSMSILCSFILFDNDLKQEILTLLIAVALNEILGRITEYKTKIKWPNDILINNKKAAGILIEFKQINKTKCFVVGIGLNCHQSQHDFNEFGLGNIATSVDIECKSRVNRNLLTAELLNTIEKWIILAKQDPEIVISEWSKYSSQLGKSLTVQYNNQSFTGSCIGLHPVNGLILQLQSGGVRMFEGSKTTIVKNS